MYQHLQFGLLLIERIGNTYNFTILTKYSYYRSMEMQAEYVKLKNIDLEILIKISQQVIDYKIKALNKTNWQIFERDYLPKLVNAFHNNSFKVVDVHNNILSWLIDQICHSRVIIPGTKHTEGVPLCDTELGQAAIEICRHASKGQISYDQFRSTNNFHDLFQ